MTEAEVNEIRILLQNHPLWNRSRLSRELCVRWNWQRPDGQIKDMACRELLRKLESRTLIKLPPRQCSGPGVSKTTQNFPRFFGFRKTYPVYSVVKLKILYYQVKISGSLVKHKPIAVSDTVYLLIYTDFGRLQIIIQATPAFTMVCM